MSLLESIGDYYNYVIDDLADERTNEWFLIKSPFPIVAILIFYHYFVYKIGPALMRNREPFKLDRIIQIYNLMQVVLCGCMVFEGIRNFYGPTGSYKLSCEPIDRSRSYLGMKAAYMAWCYFMLKLLDLLDTVFFTLRKKSSQVTFLHVYHHIGMSILSWYGVKYMPGGQGAGLVILNCFVHSLMYTYYFLSNYNPEYRKQLWWKKYLTQIQMLQFVLLLIHFGRVLFNPDCDFPIIPILVILPHDLLILYLFARFYQRAYLTPKSDSSSKKKA